MKLILSFHFMFLSSFSFAQLVPLPDASSLIDHPGSLNYTSNFKRADFKCKGRDVHVFLPDPMPADAALVVFGHGQALGVDKYSKTLEHLAKKSIVAIHPEYDSGFFDRNWTRMGSDYIQLTECALNKFPEINKNKIVFSGHSKGAYVAGVAAGLAFKNSTAIKPSSVLLINPAGLDKSLVESIGREVELTVVHSDDDSTVDRKISQDIYNYSLVSKKQFINLRSYTTKFTTKTLKAGHMWILTASSLFGGGPPNSFHYHSGWKWLVSAAEDLMLNDGEGLHPYLYGSQTTNKGINGFEDEIQKNF